MSQPLTQPQPATEPPGGLTAGRVVDLLAIVMAYRAATQAARDRLENMVRGIWWSLGEYRDPQKARFADEIVPIVEAAMAHMSSLTSGYLAAAQQQQTGRLVTPPALPPLSIRQARNGADPAEVYGRPFHLVWRQLAELPREPGSIEKAIAAGADRAVKLAFTDVQLAKRQASQESLRRDRYAIGWRRVLEGAYSCGLCIVASTQTYHRAELMPIHPGCVPAGTPVAARNVLAVSRRRYSGELVILTTAAGDEVAVTANHPVLTDRGWVPAHQVGVGDDLFRGSDRHGVVDGVPEEAQRPALIEDVWRAASVAGSLLRVPLAAEDFHADSAEGEVDVVRTDGDLAPVGDVTFGQPAGEARFGFGHGGRILLPSEGVLAALLERHLATAGNFVGGGDLLGSLLGSHLGGSVEPGRRPASRFDAPAQEFTAQSAPVYARRGLDLQRRLAGQIERDRVVDARRVSWSDHVYNLHTAEGWYASSSHIVSNCDCDVVPVYVDSDAADRANRQLLGDVHQAIADRFGVSDWAARNIPGAQDGKGNPIRYQDVLVTHEHGELGPVLAVKGRPFTGPNDLTTRPRRRSRPQRAQRTPEQIRAELSALEANLPRLTSDRQRTYTEQRIAALREQLPS